MVIIDINMFGEEKFIIIRHKITFNFSMHIERDKYAKLSAYLLDLSKIINKEIDKNSFEYIIKEYTGKDPKIKRTYIKYFKTSGDFICFSNGSFTHSINVNDKNREEIYYNLINVSKYFRDLASLSSQGSLLLESLLNQNLTLKRTDSEDN